MIIHDVTLPIGTGMVVYPGDSEVEIKPVYRITDGDSANVSQLCLGTHTGTHIDPPYHFSDSGITVDKIPLELLMGECWVYCIDGDCIGVKDLEEASIPEGTEKVIFKTHNSQLWDKNEFCAEYVHLTPDGAEWLVRHGIKVVGIDYLSIDEYGVDDNSTHQKLLNSGVIVIEGLDLRRVNEGKYTLICLPMKIAEGDGAPARVVLIE